MKSLCIEEARNTNNEIIGYNIIRTRANGTQFIRFYKTMDQVLAVLKAIWDLRINQDEN